MMTTGSNSFNALKAKCCICYARALQKYAEQAMNIRQRRIDIESISHRAVLAVVTGQSIAVNC